jgi:UDPglucose 6-dehydrogenase
LLCPAHLSKVGTDDIRESPAISIIQELLAEGAAIKAFDPAAMGRAREIFGSKITFATDPYEVAGKSDGLLILTYHSIGRASLNLERLPEASLGHGC